MKKFLLVLCLCFLLTACGGQNHIPNYNGGNGATTNQNSDISNVMAMIDGLGEITLDSIDAIRRAEDAYNALSDEEKWQVTNYQTLRDARSSYYTLWLPGQWHTAPTPWDFEYDDVPDLELNADGTYTETETAGTWYVENGYLYLQAEGRDYEISCEIKEEDGEITFYNWGYDEMIPLSQYQSITEDAFLHVDIAEVDLSEYLGFATYDYVEYDAWDEPNGNVYEVLVFANKLYDQGWIYWGVSEEFQFELNIPAYNVTFSFDTGEVYQDSYLAQTPLINHYELEFGTWGNSGLIWPYNYTAPDCVATCDLDLDDITFGRARGTMTFVNKKFVKEIWIEDGIRHLMVEVNGETSDFSTDYMNENNFY